MNITIEVTKDNIDQIRKLVNDEATLKKLVIEEMQFEKAKLQARITEIDTEMVKISKVK